MKRLAVISAFLFAGAVLAQPKPKDPYGDPGPAPIGPQPPPGGVKPPLPPKQPAPGPTPAPAPKKGPTEPAPPPAKKGPVDPYGGPVASDAGKKPAKPDPFSPAPTPGVPARVGLGDIPTIQGLLAVQRVDGWLLFDRDGENPIARRIVSPDGRPSRPWFYLIPAKGQPIALVHAAEKRSFEHLAGTKITYQGYRELDAKLRTVLKGVKSIAVEYSPRATVPSVSRVDAGTMEVIRGAGVQVRSSDTLVQYTKAIWGDPGRTAHYIAVHHLVELRKEALAFITKQITANGPVSEYDVQQKLVRGMTMRGLAGPPPVVAAGVNTADPYYVPTADKTAPIHKGDLIVISLAAKIDKPEGVYAAQTWVAVADTVVRDDYRKAFETVTAARDVALGMITDRTRKAKPVTGAEVDQATRAFIKKAGLADKIMHRTGHSLDDDLQGNGADLDDYEVKDTRILTPGTGFTVGPGLYFAGGYGLRTEVSVYLSPNGPEITTPAQDYIEALLLR